MYAGVNWRELGNYFISSRSSFIIRALLIVHYYYNNTWVQPSSPASACSFSILRLNLMLTRGILPDFRGGGHFLFKPPYAIGSVPSLSGYTNAYRWCSLPRVRRHRASSSQGSSSNGCCHFTSHHGPINVPLSFPTPTILLILILV